MAGLFARSLRHVARLDRTPFQLQILDLSHDGRGVARRDDGKAVFVAFYGPSDDVRTTVYYEQ